MPKLVRFRYNRKATEEAYRNGLPLPEPESVEYLGDAEYDEGALEQVARILYHKIKAEEIEVISCIMD